MWPFSPPTFRFEQAVYGSFAFWDRGYDVLARSPGCAPEMIAAFRQTCPQLGERPRRAAPPGGLVSRVLDDGTWMVIGPRPQGRDDRGRPDAVAFHAVFLDPRSARRLGYLPSRVRPSLRGDWDASTTSLPTGLLRPAPAGSTTEEAEDDRVARAVASLKRGDRVIVASDGPIDAFADRVWPRLPPKLRPKRSLATWAFTDAGLFDLIGLPRSAGVEPSDGLVIHRPPGPAQADLVDRPPASHPVP